MQKKCLDCEPLNIVMICWYWNNNENNEIFLRSLSLKDMPCLNCRLIEMGEMACYTERCSQVWKSNDVDDEQDNHANNLMMMANWSSELPISNIFSAVGYPLDGRLFRR